MATENEEKSTWCECCISISPAVFGIVLSITFFVTYAIGRSRDHFKDLPYSWPFVSDTGDQLPESCVFTVFVWFTSFFFFATIFIRYRYHSKAGTIRCCGYSCWASFAYFCGLVSLLGLMVLASYQTGGGASYATSSSTGQPYEQVTSMHFAGAFLAFGGMLIYGLITTCCITKEEKQKEKRCYWFRFVVLALASFAMIFFITAKVVIKSKMNEVKNLKLKADEKKRRLAEINQDFETISEWVLIYLALIYMISLTCDMIKINTKYDLIIMKEVRDEENPQQTQTTI